MKSHILKYGLIGGVILLAFGVLSSFLMTKLDYDVLEMIGYGAMVLSLMVLFFGVKNFRDKENGGKISFLKALTMGLMMGLIVSVFYVAGWVLTYDPNNTDFAEKAFVEQLEMWQQDGLTETQIETKKEEFQGLMEVYNNSLTVRVLVTFTEILPMIIVVSLASAFFLKSPFNNWK